jgi:DNA-binding NarL/FixJ family response regulator
MVTPSPINILIVDDNEVVRRSLDLFFRTQPDLNLVGEALNGKEAVASCDDLQPDVILMDINMPVMDGITATKIIQQKHPDIYVLALSSLEDNGSVKAMMEAGAKSYLLKSTSIDEIAAAIRSSCIKTP